MAAECEFSVFCAQLADSSNSHHVWNARCGCENVSENVSWRQNIWRVHIAFLMVVDVAHRTIGAMDFENMSFSTVYVLVVGVARIRDETKGERSDAFANDDLTIRLAGRTEDMFPWPVSVSEVHSKLLCCQCSLP